MRNLIVGLILGILLVLTLAAKRIETQPPFQLGVPIPNGGKALISDNKGILFLVDTNGKIQQITEKRFKYD